MLNRLSQRLLDQSGAVIRGHFVLSSGLHSDVYVQKFKLFEIPPVFCGLCAQLADLLEPHNVDYVAGPTTLGVLVAYEVAKFLGVKSLCAERSEAGFGFRRHTVPPNARIAIVDDVVTTGGSLDRMVAAVADVNGLMVARGALVVRSGCPSDIVAPCRVDAQTYSPDDLPAHLIGIPAVKLGTS